MGFRNPITSATAVGTGAAGTARVHVYESIDARGNPMGVVAFEDGVPGDTPAALYAYPYGGSLAGGGLTIFGGIYGSGKAAPTLILQTDQAGLSQAQLNAPDGLLLNGSPLEKPTVLGYGFTTGNLATTAAGTEQRIAGGLNFSATLTAGKIYRLRGRSVLNGSTAGSNGFWNWRASRGATSTPTASSTCVASVQGGFTAAGSNGRIPAAPQGLFAVSVSDTYVFSPFLFASAGQLTLVPDASGRTDAGVELAETDLTASGIAGLITL